jgi:hypothetical protein
MDPNSTTITWFHFLANLQFTDHLAPICVIQTAEGAVKTESSVRPRDDLQPQCLSTDLRSVVPATCSGPPRVFRWSLGPRVVRVVRLEHVFPHLRRWRLISTPTMQLTHRMHGRSSALQDMQHAGKRFNPFYFGPPNFRVLDAVYRVRSLYSTRMKNVMGWSWGCSGELLEKSWRVYLDVL